jgi:hypothetical protein
MQNITALWGNVKLDANVFFFSFSHFGISLTSCLLVMLQGYNE